MGHSRPTKKTDSVHEESIEVLYQKMGDRWFAFSLIDDEVFVGSVSQDVIDGRADTHAGEDSKDNGIA